MKINIEKNDLFYAVQVVVRAVSNKNTLPILSGILLDAHNNTLSLKATDLDLAMECSVSADVIEEGQTVVQGKLFSNMIALLPNGNIELESNKEKLIIKAESEKNESSIKCLDVDEFPMLPIINGNVEGVIPAGVFKRLVRQVSIAVATDEIRPMFTGMLIKLSNNNITMVATDTHRLAIGKGGWQGKGEVSLILPCRTMKEIASLTNNDEDIIKLIANNNEVYFTLNNITFASRVISGQYPDYQQVLPADALYCSYSVLNKDSKQKLIMALEMAILITRDSARGKTNIVKLKWQDDQLILSADGHDTGDIHVEVPITKEGENITASYNARYLLDALKIIDDEQIAFHLTGPTTPGVIIPDGQSRDNSSYIYLVLPMRVSN